MKLCKRSALTLLLTLLAWPVSVRGEDIEDVKLICETVFLENEAAFACVDFSSDYICEVYLDGALMENGTALHHVVLPVTLEKTAEITILVDNGDDCYETSFVITPRIETAISEEAEEKPEAFLNVEDPDLKESRNEKRNDQEDLQADDQTELQHEEETEPESGLQIAQSDEDSDEMTDDTGSFYTAPYVRDTSTEVKTEYITAIEKVFRKEDNPNPVDEESGRKEDSAAKKRADEAVSAKNQKNKVQKSSENEDNTQTGQEKQCLPENGIYKPDSFQWSGGTGKLKGIFCKQITVKAGEATAILVFSSGYYRYIKIQEEKYKPIEQTEESTTFEIPVILNRNMPITAMTEAMSQPHEITYTIYIGFHDGNDSKSQQPVQLLSGEWMILPDAYTHDALSYLGSLKTEAAALFRIHYYEQNLAVLEIPLPEKFQNPEKEQTQQKSDLYGQEKLRFLIVPKGKEAPAGLEKELIVVQKPIDAAYANVQTVWKYLEENQLLSRLFAVSKTARSSEYKDLTEGISSDEILCLEAPKDISLKSLLKGKCDLFAAETEAFDDQEQWKKLTEDLNLLNIPLFLDRSCEELTPEGQEEWNLGYQLIFEEDGLW